MGTGLVVPDLQAENVWDLKFTGVSDTHALFRPPSRATELPRMLQSCTAKLEEFTQQQARHSAHRRVLTAQLGARPGHQSRPACCCQQPSKQRWHPLVASYILLCLTDLRFSARGPASWPSRVWKLANILQPAAVQQAKHPKDNSLEAPLTHLGVSTGPARRASSASKLPSMVLPAAVKASSSSP